MKKVFDVEFYSQLLDKINANIYITDVETDEIVYMNDAMKQTFGLEKPEGCICWKVLQKGMKGRCGFCQIHRLLSDTQDGAVNWRECNTVTGHTYQNCDSLVEVNGKKYHFQHSVDISEQIKLSQYAKTDDLTGILNRRAGKERLSQLLDTLKEGESFIVVMMDVNQLKRINDRMGHLEGDRMLKFVVKSTQACMEKDDFMFRLSGDEFIAVLFHRSLDEAGQWSDQVLERMSYTRQFHGITYEVSFSSGLVEVQGGSGYTVSEILSMADACMYESKRKFYSSNGGAGQVLQETDRPDTLPVSSQEKKDGITGVLNRMEGKEHLWAALRKTKMKGGSLTVALLDVDNLNMINETYGGRAGDTLLVQVTDVVKKRVEKPDFLFRLSGDEFMAVSFHMNEREMSKLFLDSLKELKAFQEQKNIPYEMTFSFGTYTVGPDNPLSVNSIIAKADEIMYMQKLRKRKTKMLEENENPFRHSDGAAGWREYDSSLLYDALTKSTDDFIYICNMKTGVFRYSPAQVWLFNMPGEVLDNPLPIWKEIVHPDDWERFYKSNMEIGENMMDYHSVEFRAKNREGEYLWMRCRGQMMRDEFGEPSVFAGIMTQLGRQNKVDPVTQLLNHIEFFRVFEKKIRDKMAVERLGILLLGLDNFKQVNEIYDRSMGDHILKTVAQSIQSILPDNAGLFKLDNDCMGILMDNVGHRDMETLYMEIRNMMGRMHFWNQYKLNLTLSAGGVMYPEDGGAASELFKYAEYSLRYAKEKGRDRIVFFSKEILENQKKTLKIMMALRESVNSGFTGFSLRYQPQVDAASRTIIGAEALLRWTDPDGSIVSPVEFIPILEETGMIIQVGQWTLRTAMRTARPWLKKNPDFSLSVNVSVPQMMEADFVENVLDAVGEEEYPCCSLMLELTESCKIHDMGLFYKKFESLRAHGIQIAMDDFGTGYSSLELLKFAPVDVVKIDRIFIKDILKSKFDATFIQFVVAICHSIGIKVCLEGMETAEEYEALKTVGLNYIQGYLFGRPMTEVEFFQWEEAGE